MCFGRQTQPHDIASKSVYLEAFPKTWVKSETNVDTYF